MCQPCPTGQYSQANGSTACSPCPATPLRETIQICPAGSPAPYTPPSELTQTSGYAPTIPVTITSDLETMFYLSCWPLMTYAVAGVLLLGIVLFVLNRMLRDSPGWTVVTGALLRFNVFDETEGHKAGPGAQHSEAPMLRERLGVEDSDDEGTEREEGEGGRGEALIHAVIVPQHAGRVDVFLKWLGFLFTLLLCFALVIGCIFTVVYMRIALNNHEYVMKTIPNDHSLQDDPLNRPTLNFTIHFYGYRFGCDNQTLPLSLSNSLQPARPKHLGQGPLICAISIICSNVTPESGASIGIGFIGPTSPPQPFYAQAIEYRLNVTYPPTNDGWWNRMPHGVGTKGASWVSGTILAGSNRVQRGNTVVQLASTLRPVETCERAQSAPDTSEFWTSIIKDQGMDCKPTGAGVKIYSIKQVDAADISADDYWNIESSNFSLVIRLQEGEFISHVYLL